MHIKKIIYMLGIMLSVLAVTMIFPLAWSIYYGSYDMMALVQSIIVTTVVALIFIFAGQSKGDVTLKESFVFVSLGWLTAALFGSLPFLFSGVLSDFSMAFFESMSGFTTTGATVIDIIEEVPPGVLFWRSLTHWLGGMGIIALFVAILPRLGFGGIHLLKAEVPGLYPEKITPRIAETAKLLWLIYVFMSLIQTILLLLSGLSLFDALTHTFGTLATGGFSTRDASVAGLNNFKAELVIMFFMIIAGGNFALYYSLFKGKIGQLFKNAEFRFYLFFMFVMSVLTTVVIYTSGVHILTSIRQGFFQVISIVTTTGFGTADFDKWPSFARILMFALMFAGGSGGSTSGSIKQIRLLIVLKLIYREAVKVIHPTAVIPVRIGRKVIPESIIDNTLAFVSLYIFIFIFSSLIMSLFNLDMISAMSSVAATLGNVGPGLGLVGPTNTYSFMPPTAMLFLSFLMMLGRLEIFTVVVLLLPEFRKG